MRPASRNPIRSAPRGSRPTRTSGRRRSRRLIQATSGCGRTARESFPVSRVCRPAISASFFLSSGRNSPEVPKRFTGTSIRRANSTSVVIDDLHSGRAGVAGRPLEEDPPLVFVANAPLSLASALQRLEAGCPHGHCRQDFLPHRVGRACAGRSAQNPGMPLCGGGHKTPLSSCPRSRQSQSFRPGNTRTMLFVAIT